ncbi:hypothetical protein JW890_00135 [candidate division WOR-3 bacterium]|nr:hypothetical protein [candidate division WOR-3 bacterium]
MTSNFSPSAKVLFFFSCFLFLFYSESFLYSASVFALVSAFFLFSKNLKRFVFSILGFALCTTFYFFGKAAAVPFFKLVSVLYLSFIFSNALSAEDFVSLPFYGKTALSKSFYIIWEISSSFAPFLRSELNCALLNLRINKNGRYGSYSLFPMLVNWSFLKIKLRKRDLYYSLFSRGFKDTDDLERLTEKNRFPKGDLFLYLQIILFTLWRIFF